MGDAARAFGEDTARTSKGAATVQTVSAQVVDVTDRGVNLMLSGALVIDVPCLGAYRNRQPGDWVMVRTGSRPVVLGRPEDDPGGTDEESVRAIATEVALDAQVMRAATWGTAAPSGTGWQTVTTMYLRKNSEGKVELYGQLGSQSDTSPSAPPARGAKPVTLTPTDYGSWRTGKPDSYATYPTQGDWTGGGNRRGAFFYGTAIAAACAGKTVTRMELTLTRRRGSGVNAARPVHVYLHGYTSAPSGQLTLGDGPQSLMSLSVGATRTAVLPSAWRSALASGSARGFAVYATGSRDYMSLSGGKLKITFG
ncbi:hypothetical protein [Streptomyces flaveolus]|uniref:hypothetical protein n=1 Tax=Streptomyces flaveolus TaxID=67297 RepID=UPI0016710C1E|nr:hypothetical protein [Streptomyces flaveolus]GGQ81354.1 hypothetical protein GCM10010216_49020 [Streptomyces flaveolus]